MQRYWVRVSALLSIMLVLSSLTAPLAVARAQMRLPGHKSAADSRSEHKAVHQVAPVLPQNQDTQSEGQKVWLPLVFHEQANDLGGAAIWAVLNGTEPGSVALFRHRFEIAQPYDRARLHILSDTRYEAWLDGEWIGRGPARFSRVRQEFDTLDLGELAAGTHAIAVLVQYAPNVRRSETLEPAVQASLEGHTESGWQTLAATCGMWKALVSPAWDKDAREVSQLGLIGPAEVLDLRRLPADWMILAFDDTAWPPAVELAATPFSAPAERTIPHLRDVPRPPVAEVESGLLSPGWRLVELEHPGGDSLPVTVTLHVTATQATTLRIEALESDPIRVDGSASLTWIPAEDPRRPDLQQGQLTVSAGPHTLEIWVPAARPCEAGLPRLPGYLDIASQALSTCQMSSGRSLAIYETDLQVGGSRVPLQSHDPGRRTLLANPSPGGHGAPEVLLFPDSAQITIPAGDTPRYATLDFGRTIHGRVSMNVSGPQGTVIDVGWDERLTEGRPLPNPGSLVYNLWSQVDSWALDGNRRHLTTLDARSGRYMMLMVYGMGPVYLTDVRVMEETYPLEQVGWFSSSDPLLDNVWQVGIDTIIPNRTDALTDTPWRERGMWWADAMISQEVARVVFGDVDLFRRGLRLMADAVDAEGRPAALAPNGSGIMILDFGMLWLEGLHDYWKLTDDISLVSELYPAAQRLHGFLASYLGTSGLMDVTPDHWSQSALIDWPAVTSRSGESTALNAQYSDNLRRMGEIAEALGELEAADDYYTRSEDVRNAINGVLYLPVEGCYAASRLNGELLEPTIHAQAWAIRYGIVPDEHLASTTQSLIAFMEPFFEASGAPVVEALGMYGVLKAVARTTQTGEMLNFVREPYGAMLAGGATTWWELFSPNLDRGHSLSHAWGSSPTWFLTAHVLGANVVGPSSWEVTPHPGDLHYASGAVPAGPGLLSLGWQKPECGQFHLEVSSPETMTGTVLLPTVRPDVLVILDDVVIWDQGPIEGQPVELTREGLLVSGLSGGSHEIWLSFACFHSYLPWISR